MRSRSTQPRRRCTRDTCCSLLLAATWLLAACSDPKQQPAQEAIARIEAVISEAGTAASKYIPGDLQDVETKVGNLKTRFEHGDFDGVLRDAPAVLAEARALKPTAQHREADLLRSLQVEWTSFAADMPAQLANVRTRLQALARANPQPGRLMPRELTQAVRQVADAEALWRRAGENYAAQRLPEAVTLAGQARDLLQRVAALPGVGTETAAVK
jgi:hypothetical protein